MFTPTGGLEFVYPTAPIRIHPSDIPNFSSNNSNNNNTQGPSPPNPTTSTPSSSTTKATPHASGDGSQNDANQSLPDAYGWWIRRGETEPFTYEGMETGFEKVAEGLRNEGPFDGVMGFSQGGALAGMVASLLEKGRREAFEEAQGTDEGARNDKKPIRRAAQKGGMPYPKSFTAPQPTPNSPDPSTPIHPPLRFAISYSGFGASTNPLYSAFYNPPIATPMLHFLGSVDTVVEEARSLRLVDACAGNDEEKQRGRRVIYHPGGHFLPSSQVYVRAVAGFIRECLGWDGDGGGVVGESKGQQGGGKKKTQGMEEPVEDMDVPF